MQPSWSHRFLSSSLDRATILDEDSQGVDLRFLLTLLLGLPFALPTLAAATQKRPNILLIISDDQSWPHASAYGDSTARTPNFDKVARQGVLFNNAFCASPGCSPSRAALLSGMHTWQLREAGTHASGFPFALKSFPEQLGQAGYSTGYCGKGWGPGKFHVAGRMQNPAGPNFPVKKKADGSADYAGAFRNFLEKRRSDQPFCFWFGSNDPHRSYKKGSGLTAGRELDEAVVPAFLPDCPEIRSDLLDYAVEVERFDRDLGEYLALLDEFQLAENTLVIVTSDNGMPFPRAKANCYEYGIHTPLAVRWPRSIPDNRTIDDLVGFVDLTATIYEAAGVEPAGDVNLTGKSLLADLKSSRQGKVDENRTQVYAARERHSSVRFRSLGYPQRCIRTTDFLYIINFRAERWPAGAPQKYGVGGYPGHDSVLNRQLGPMHGGYHDIDACPTLSFLIENRHDEAIDRFLRLAVLHRPSEELFAIKEDPACLKNLAGIPRHEATRKRLNEQLIDYLRKTEDARILDADRGDVWESYPRYSRLRWFPNPAWVDKNTRLPKQDWWETRKPKKSKSPKE